MIPADTLLDIKDWALGGGLHQKSQGKKNRGSDSEDGKGKDNIASALDCSGALGLQPDELSGGQVWRPQSEDRAGLNLRRRSKTEHAERSTSTDES